MEKINFYKLRKTVTSATTTFAGTNLNRGILDELAGRLVYFHDSARALASCVQNRDVSDQSMIEAAMCMFRKLLGEARADLERVTPQSHENPHIETTRNKRRCSRSEKPSEEPCSRPEKQSEKSVWQTPTDGTPISVPIPPSPPDRSGIHPEKLESVSKTHPSSEPLEQVVEGDPRKQLVLSVLLFEPGERTYESKMPSFTTTILDWLFAEAEQRCVDMECTMTGTHVIRILNCRSQ